jgi:hypothetical protein
MIAKCTIRRATVNDIFLKQNDNYITFTFIYYERIDNGRENDFAD